MEEPIDVVSTPDDLEECEDILKIDHPLERELSESTYEGSAAEKKDDDGKAPSEELGSLKIDEEGQKLAASQDERHGKQSEKELRDASGGTGASSPSQKPKSSFAQIVRKWENYMSSPSSSSGEAGLPDQAMLETESNIVGNSLQMFQPDQFQPLQMFQHLNFCGASEGLARLPAAAANAAAGFTYHEQDTSLEQVFFKHTRSSPLKETPAMVNKEEILPPPIGLTKINRSRSTPLNTSANSAFGTIMRTIPYLGAGSTDRSAFSHPAQRTSTGVSTSNPDSKYSVFNPIRCGTEMDGVDPTSIEVTHLEPSKPTKVKDKIGKEGAVSRASKFLSDMLKKRAKAARSGRENPARPPSSSDESSAKTSQNDDNTTVSSAHSHDGSTNAAIVTHADDRKVEVKKALSPTPQDSKDTSDQKSVDRMDAEETPDSIQHEEIIEHAVVGTRQGIQVQVSVSEPAPSTSETGSNMSYSTTNSPEPKDMEGNSSNTSEQFHDSPGASRSSGGTTTTSGHTTQATNSSAQMSTLTAISETDREVMEANKAAKLLRANEKSTASKESSTEGDSTSLHSSSTGTTNPHSYGPSSPVSLRDGANVPAERFFTMNDGSTAVGSQRPKDRLRSSSVQKKPLSASPSTVSSASMTNSSASSMGDQPPKFVSYLDRKLPSDLTSLRESGQKVTTVQEEGAPEKRESPPDIMGNVIFEEAVAPEEAEEESPKAEPTVPVQKGGAFERRIRSLPPALSPTNRGLTSTPPPVSSPTVAGVSPPRNIVDHKSLDPNLSKPYVLRQKAPLVPPPEVLQSSGDVTYTHIVGSGSDLDAHEIVRQDTDRQNEDESKQGVASAIFGKMFGGEQRSSPPSLARAQTYGEHNIEILKTDSNEEPRSSPEAKDASKL